MKILQKCTLFLQIQQSEKSTSSSARGAITTRFAAVGDGSDPWLLVKETIYDRWRQQRSVIDVFLVYDRDR